MSTAFWNNEVVYEGVWYKNLLLHKPDLVCIDSPFSVVAYLGTKGQKSYFNSYIWLNYILNTSTMHQLRVHQPNLNIKMRLFTQWGEFFFFPHHCQEHI